LLNLQRRQHAGAVGAGGAPDVGPPRCLPAGRCRLQVSTRLRVLVPVSTKLRVLEAARARAARVHWQALASGSPEQATRSGLPSDTPQALRPSLLSALPRWPRCSMLPRTAPQSGGCCSCRLVEPAFALVGWL
jgi:hypothetical protein